MTPGFQYWRNYALGDIVEMHVGVQKRHGHPDWQDGAAFTNERMRKKE
jgi:hypothetical protein